MSVQTFFKKSFPSPRRDRPVLITPHLVNKWTIVCSVVDRRYSNPISSGCFVTLVLEERSVRVCGGGGRKL